jgi:hypothetical protein
MNTETAIILGTGLFTSIALLIMVQDCLGHLLCSIGRANFCCGPADADDPRTADTTDAPDYGRYGQEFVEQRFESVGAAWEEVVAVPRSTYVVFVRPDGCFANVRKGTGGEFRVTLVTGFSDGGSVATSNYSRRRDEGDGYLAWGVPTTSVARLVSEHDSAVSQAVQGREPRTCRTLQDVLDMAHEQFFHPVLQRHFRAGTRAVFWERASLSFFCVLLIFSAAVLGRKVLGEFAPLIASVVSLVMALVLHFGYQGDKKLVGRELAKEQQEADAERTR